MQQQRKEGLPSCHRWAVAQRRGKQSRVGPATPVEPRQRCTCPAAQPRTRFQRRQRRAPPGPPPLPVKQQHWPPLSSAARAWPCGGQGPWPRLPQRTPHPRHQQARLSPQGGARARCGWGGGGGGRGGAETAQYPPQRWRRGSSRNDGGGLALLPGRRRRAAGQNQAFWQPQVRHSRLTSRKPPCGG